MCSTQEQVQLMTPAVLGVGDTNTGGRIQQELSELPAQMVAMAFLSLFIADYVDCSTINNYKFLQLLAHCINALFFRKKSIVELFQINRGIPY